MQIPLPFALNTILDPAVSSDTFELASTTDQSPLATRAAFSTLSPLSFATDGTIPQPGRSRPCPIYAPTGHVSGASPSLPSDDRSSSSHFNALALVPSSQPSLSVRPRSRVRHDSRASNTSASSTMSSHKSGETSPNEPFSDHPLIAPASIHPPTEASTKKRSRPAIDIEPEDVQDEPRPKLSSKAAITTSFIYKLFDILEDPANVNMISYGITPGTFQVHDTLSLAGNILPRYFKHSNFASFARQLNMWGWRKETRNGGWSFIHPIFRKGRRDLLAGIKRADEAAKKRPETVGARRGPSRPLEPPRTESTQAAEHRQLSVDIPFTSVPLVPRRSESRSAFDPFDSTSQHRADSVSSGIWTDQCDDRSATSMAHSSNPSPIFSPLFNPDGSHTRPVLPPSFVDAPRSHASPSFFDREVPRGRCDCSGESPSTEMQLGEAKKRLDMTTTLLEHVLHRLGVEATDERFRSFPFYVLDPRFSDPSTPMQTIVADFDARRAACEPVSAAATSLFPEPVHANYALPPTALADSSRSVLPSSGFYSAGIPSGTFDPAHSNMLPHGLSIRGEDSFATRRRQAHSSALRDDTLPRPRPSEEGGSREVRTQRPRSLRRKPSSGPPARPPTLGPSSFSLVDFSISQPSPIVPSPSEPRLHPEPISRVARSTCPLSPNQPSGTSSHHSLSY